MSAAKNSGPARRSNHVRMPVAYAAVGASNAPDLLRFPPEGSTPYEEEHKLGSGQERFLVASSLLMTWGAQRGAGYMIEDVVRGDGEQYLGVVFDDAGRPAAVSETEDHFGPDGEPYLTAGTTATIVRGAGEKPRAVMVVYTVDEPRRLGFAWGTADENGAVGEQLLTVEHRDDDTVWATARGFMTAPASGLLGLKGRAALKSELAAVQEQLRALAPQAVVEAGLLPDLGAGAGGQKQITAQAGAPEAGAPAVDDPEADDAAAGRP